MVELQVLGYVGATATDLGAWREFNSSILGFEASPESTDDALYLRYDEQHHRLAVHAGDVDDIAYVGWEVRDDRALAGATQRLETNGIVVKAGSPDEIAQRCVLDLVWFECPHTSVRMELFVGAEALFQPRFKPSRPIGGFVTGDEGMGHVVLYTGDVPAAEAFYVDLLGFAVTDRVIVPGFGQIASFMHCNSRHHTFALMGIPDAPRRLQHVMVEATDIDTVGTTYDLCVERDIVSATLRRHLNDRALSFYLATPSGWHMEYAWNPRSIDPTTWRTQHFNGLRPDGEWGHAGLTEML